MLIRIGLVLCAGIVLAANAFAQHHHDDDHHENELHFSHPLIAESPSPDTKIRFDYFYRRLRNGERAGEHTPRVEFEYAFSPNFSIETDVPYTFRNVQGDPRVSHLDSIEVAIKLANDHFKEHHVLLVYGVGFELPTGSDDKEIGSRHIVGIEPYFGVGVKREKLEVITRGTVGFAANKRTTDDEPTELGYNLSFLFKPTQSIQPIIELDGQTALTGSESRRTVVNVSPGIKFVLSEHWQVGAGVGFPVTNVQEFKSRAVFSMFYHF